MACPYNSILLRNLGLTRLRQRGGTRGATSPLSRRSGPPRHFKPLEPPDSSRDFYGNQNRTVGVSNLPVPETKISLFDVIFRIHVFFHYFQQEPVRKSLRNLLKMVEKKT